MEKTRWSDMEKNVKNKKLYKYIINILEYERSKLHQIEPRFKEIYNEIIEEVLRNEDKENNSK